MEALCRIGTSGWSYSHWRGVFYDPQSNPKDWFDHYQTVFDTVELNSTFYHLPNEQTFRNWAKHSREDFLFAVKASRYITHLKKFKDTEEAIGQLLERAGYLGDKLGPLLFQLPPHWKADPERLDAVLKLKPPGHRWAFEFRDPTWFASQVYSVLERHGAAFCIYHMSGTECPVLLSADWVYLRFHGAAYSTQYSPEELRLWAGRIQDWLASGYKCFAYFNNDTAGFAVQNARQLKGLLYGDKLKTT